MASTLQEEFEASHWGIEPVPDEHRKLSGFDLGILWGDLGVGLLVIVAGALIVAPFEPFGFSLPEAVLAIVVGSLIGCLLLGLGGLIGSREALPTMVLLRPVLGLKGSWIPTILNVGQLVGWTAFELWAMALVGRRLGERLFGFSSFSFWLFFFSIVVLALSLWGPLGVVRHWMEKFGAWVVAGIGLAITVLLVTQVEMGSLWARPGRGGAAWLGLPLDIVIALPVSWIPLVADYNRFSSQRKGSFWGTTVGYLIANIWFYALGALLVLNSPNIAVDPGGIAISILALGGISITGTLMLAGLLVGETDEAFADVYSGAVSLRNILPNIDSRILVVGVTAAGMVLAGRFTMLTYESFLFLLGSVFLPLLGVWFADYFVLKVPGSATKSFRWESLIPWLAGFVVYHWIAPTPIEWWTKLVSGLFGDPLSFRFPWLGASLPSFLVAFVLHIVIGSMSRTGGSQPKDATSAGVSTEV